ADDYDDPAWKAFVDAYRKEFKDGLPSPSLFAHAYYVNTKALLDGLDAVGGDLADGHAKLRKQLASMTVKTPTGDVRLDENRNAIANIFLTEVARAEDGSFYNKFVKVVPNVDQYLGMTRDEFMKMGVGTRTNPECK